MIGNPEERHVVVVVNGEFQHSSRLLPIVDRADVIVADFREQESLIEYLWGDTKGARDGNRSPYALSHF